MGIMLRHGVRDLATMRRLWDGMEFAEGGFTSPDYPPINSVPKRNDINDNEKRARGKWHVENAKDHPDSIITKAFNEAKQRGLSDEQAYEYVADVAKQHGWSKEGSIVGERTIQYKASPNITLSDNNVSPKYITSEPMSDEEYQRRKAQQFIRQSQETGNPNVIYDSDEKVKRDNPNNPRTPFEPHPITPKEMDITLKGLRFLQPFDPTGLTGVPDFLNSVASGENVGMNFVGMLPAVGKVKAVENGSRLARFNNNILDTGEEVLGNLVGRISPRAGNFINTTTSAVQDITTKPATEIVKQLMQKRGTQAANSFATGWNLGATTVNFGRAGEDVYDFYTEDPLIQSIKEGFQFAEGGLLDDPPYWSEPDKQLMEPIEYADKRKEKRLQRHYKRSAKIMNLGQKIWGEDMGGYEDPFTGWQEGAKFTALFNPYRNNNNGVAQATFLMPREEQAEMFRRAGYTERPGDYGLVKKAVEKDGRDIPVWQSKPDAAKRDDLIYLGYTLDEDGEPALYLEDPGNFPTAYYVDSKTGKGYVKGWDLNDYDFYGKDIRSRAANIVNRIGNPVVVTSGIQPSELEYWPFEIYDKMYKQHHLVPMINYLWDDPTLGEDYEKLIQIPWVLPEVKIHSKEKGGSIDEPPYTKFLNTLPDNLKNSGDEYNMRRYWELNGYPKDFNEGIQKGLFTKQDDGYHANSVAFNPITNSYEFMKDRNHPTYNMELDWYYSDDPEAVEFRKEYKYTPGIGMIPDQYTPRRFGNGERNRNEK
jgi:hypothetical protein